LIPSLSLVFPQSYDVRVARLHFSARLAIKSGREDTAKKFYLLIIYNWKGEITAESALPQTYLLLALLEQKRKNYDAARSVFLEGTSRFPQCGRLKQAHALFESKYGSISIARLLAHEAVEVDPSLAPLLRWKIFQEH